MLLRAVEIILIGALLTGSISWLIWEYYIKPREANRISAEKKNELAIAGAIEDYLKIRKTWVEISLNESHEFFMTSMNDMRIEEVNKFQKHMVAMNAEYGKLKDADKAVKTDEVFVQKVVALRELFDDATIRTKQLER